jgi:hypothetical protein
MWAVSGNHFPRSPAPDAAVRRDLLAHSLRGTGIMFGRCGDVRKGWTREDSLRMAYLAATGQLICEVCKGRDTEDIPDRLKGLLAELGAYDKQQERSDDPLAN